MEKFFRLFFLALLMVITYATATPVAVADAAPEPFRRFYTVGLKYPKGIFVGGYPYYGGFFRSPYYGRYVGYGYGYAYGKSGFGYYG